MGHSLRPPPRNAAPPKEFLDALKKNKKAAVFFTKLSKTNVYAITYRLQNAKKPETRTRWIEKIIAMLAAGKIDL